MKSTYTRSVAQVITLAALVSVSAVLPVWGGTDVGNGFGMIGIVRGQTARLNMVNLGGPDTRCQAEVMFLDSEGNTLAEHGIIIIGGTSASLDLNADALGSPDTFGRFQIRVMVALGGPDTKGGEVRACTNNLIPTLEIFNNASGQTTIILHPTVLKGFNPQPDPPSAPAGQ